MKTFTIEYTNKDIYEKIEELCVHVSKTNGKVKLNRWIATTGLTLVLTLACKLLFL